MAGEITIPFFGNLTADPELRFTPNGAAVAKFNVANTPRTFDRQANEYRDGKTNFFTCEVWREQAENIAESLTKGMRVVGIGTIKTEEWNDRETGEKRTRQIIDVQEIGPALRYATAKVTKAQRGGNQQGGQQQGGGNDNWGGGQQQGGQQQGNAQQGGDPWGGGNAQQGGQQGGNDPWGGNQQGGNDPWGN